MSEGNYRGGRNDHKIRIQGTRSRKQGAARLDGIREWRDHSRRLWLISVVKLGHQRQVKAPNCFIFAQPPCCDLLNGNAVTVVASE